MLTVNLFVIFHTILTVVFGFIFGSFMCGYRVYDQTLYFLIITIIFVIDLTIGFLFSQKRNISPQQITLKLLVGSFTALLLTAIIVACLD